ncbi:sulfurtransferase TusA family protein [Paracoccus sp. DMF-8]|uniref:sulfurtransferase TusA family protein n=1 Tax=Paracoccus sp. DMF-8 TaxID=3019445 RepID=UPI0023E35952|nr:sulfurtransferase TusA family protein [Paracoccus sp. DMF-8]MDF3608000.1 sulfurtransferase TusA family protein [Paracoccus sp. DMF-8]
MTTIDARGLLCPLPVLRLRKVLNGLEPGAEVTLIATDPAAEIDVPHFCHQSGHEWLGAGAGDGNSRAYRVRRGPDRTPLPDD